MPLLDRGKRLILLCGLALTLGMGLFYVFSPAILPHLDHKVYDVFLAGMPPGRPGGQVVILDVDEPSLAEYGQWPWPRYRVALLLAKLQQMKPACVALDMVFAEADRTSPKVMQDQLKRDLKVNMGFGGLPEGLMEYDPILAGILAKGPFVLGYDFLFGNQPGGHREDAPKPLNLAWLKSPGAAEADLFRARDVVRNLPILSSAAPGGGYFNTLTDPDGVLRRLPLIMRYKERIYPSLALAALVQALGAGQAVAKLDSGGLEWLKLGSRIIPLGAKGTMLIRYRGGRRTFEYISAKQVLSGKTPPGAVAGKIVIVGTSAGGLKDLRTTPLASAYPGVEVHASVVDNILQGDFLRRPAWAPGLELMVTLAAGLLSCLLLAFSRPLWSLVWGLALGLGMWFGAAQFMQSAGMFVSPLMPILAMLVNFICLSLVKYWFEEKRKRYFRNAFSHYVSPAVVDRLAGSPDLLSLRGEEREVTVFFSDIRGFTGLSESLKPQEITRLLKAYFTPAVHSITSKGGTLDKFMGDAVMAFWNAPLDAKDHQAKAVETSLEIMANLDQVNRELKEQLGCSIKAGVGLASGQAYVGNMGTDQLFNYTALGDTVNLASRLEGLTKIYGVDIIANEAVAGACQGRFRFQPLDRVRVKGKKKAVTIYTAYGKEQAQELAAELDLHARAWEAFWALDFETAAGLFEELCSKYPRLPVYARFFEVSRKFRERSPESRDQMVFDHLAK